MGEREPWYVTAFGSGYRELYPHRDLDSARSEARHLVQRGLGGLVLDLCCGFGRHSLALLELGVEVLGVDLSEDLLRGAADLEGGSALSGRLVRADARRVPCVGSSFDGLVNLFSSFGYFGDDGDRQVLDEFARLLKPGGLGVLDLMNPARIRASLVPESERRHGELIIHEQRTLEDGGRRVTKRVRMTSSDGVEHSWCEDVRMYELDELRPLLTARGLGLELVEGDFDGSELSADSGRQLLFLRRTQGCGT